MRALVGGNDERDENELFGSVTVELGSLTLVLTPHAALALAELLRESALAVADCEVSGRA